MTYVKNLRITTTFASLRPSDYFLGSSVGLFTAPFTYRLRKLCPRSSAIIWLRIICARGEPSPRFWISRWSCSRKVLIVSIPKKYLWGSTPDYTDGCKTAMHLLFWFESRWARHISPLFSSIITNQQTIDFRSPFCSRYKNPRCSYFIGLTCLISSCHSNLDYSPACHS